MSNAVIAEPGVREGAVKVLSDNELTLLSDHLLRLDPQSRRDRFNGIVDDDFLIRYAAACADEGVTVIGYIERGEVHAAAEIHEPNRSPDATPEIAFSVERHLRRKGVGSVLFAALLIEAKRAGYQSLRVTTGAQNDAMRALAHKFGARLDFHHGELSGRIDLTTVKPPAVIPDATTPEYDLTHAIAGLNYALQNPVPRL